MKSNSTLKVFAFINDYINQHGYAPSIREIQDGMKFRSISSACYHLEKLFDCGLLETDLHDGKGHPRAFRIARNIFEDKK